MFPFKSISNRSLGIDISSPSIKIIELSCQNHTYQVENYAILPFPPDTVIEKIINHPEAVKNTIKKALSLAGSISPRAVIALPDSLVITKVLAIPQDLRKSELENYLWLEATHFIPYALNEMSLDFNTINPSKDLTQQTKVLLVVARTKDIHQRTQLLTQLGLEVTVVDVESFAMARVYRFITDNLPHADPNKTIAINATMPEISDLIQKIFKSQTSMIHPFETMFLKPTINFENFEKDKSSLLMACGLALRGLV